MILENLEDRIAGGKVTRICDECGKKSLVFKGAVRIARKRNKGKDYCKKCSYKYRVLPKITGENNPFWKGGKWLTQNGYYRLGSGKYEHKEILSKYLGRELGRNEKIHHIDCVKTNNDVSNMFLCENKMQHWTCHQSMEKCGFLFFGRKIWFDRNNKKYVLSESCSKSGVECDITDILRIRTYKERRREASGEYLVPTNSRLKLKHIHVMIMERLIGRRLFANECTHHINGNTLDNSFDNLCLMTRSEHKSCHYSLQLCVASLYRDGFVGFENGKYFVKENKNETCDRGIPQQD